MVYNGKESASKVTDMPNRTHIMFVFANNRNFREKK